MNWVTRKPSLGVGRFSKSMYGVSSLTSVLLLTAFDSAHGREQVAARLLAAAAHGGADAAVLVVLGVALALLVTGAACHHAGFDRRADDADVGLGLAGHDAAGR